MIHHFLSELWATLLALSPALLFGLLLAGLLHVYLPKRWIRQRLQRSNLASSARAALIGVPMPLCSCGVLPTAIALHRDGASKGATTAFLISTPQTGVDSILVSASFLGWPFALFKVVAAFVTGLFGGALVNRFEPAEEVAEQAWPIETDDSGKGGIVEALRYALFDLLASIDLWIIAGVVIAAAIATLVPDDLFAAQPWSQGLAGMLLMLAIALPLYICTTGSVPIAASLVAAGMPAGAALVFLMAGPATNIATIGALYRALGVRVLSAYLATVVIMSIAFGLGFQWLISEDIAATAHHHHTEPTLMAKLATLLLLALLLFLIVRRLLPRAAVEADASSEPDQEALTLKVSGMSCQHCVGNVRDALEALPGVTRAEPDLAAGEVHVVGSGLDRDLLAESIRSAGYQVGE